MKGTVGCGNVYCAFYRLGVAAPGRFLFFFVRIPYKELTANFTFERQKVKYSFSLWVKAPPTEIEFQFSWKNGHGYARRAGLAFHEAPCRQINQRNFAHVELTSCFATPRAHLWSQYPPYSNCQTFGNFRQNAYALLSTFE